MRSIRPGASQLTSAEAAEALGISLPTLYAYVSRGLISSSAHSTSKRKLYDAEDVRRLANRQQGRRDPQQVAEEALEWGEPVIASELSLIRGGCLYYRGQDAVQIARTESFERVAALLMNGALESANGLFGVEPPVFSNTIQVILDQLAEAEPVVKFSVLMPLLSHESPHAYHPPLSAASGADMLQAMAMVVSGGAGEVKIADRLAQAWSKPDCRSQIDVMLILCADHELNVSSFVARCVASAGSNVYDAASAGLAALMGPKHGGVTRRVRAMLREIRGSKSIAAGLEDRVRRGESVPGFGHALYPEGDPRAVVLMDLAAQHCTTETTDFVLEVGRQAERLIGERPNLDFGLVAACHALGLPTHAPMTLFAIGRASGWAAHAIEEKRRDKLIRPRARYIGPLPGTQSSVG